MKMPRVIILAAGQSQRFGNEMGVPKPLAPFGRESLLRRNLRQLDEVGFDDLTIVLGHQADMIAKEARDYFPDIKTVFNDRYKEDRNILSLLLGIGESREPALVFEADVALSDMTMPRIRLALSQSAASFWTACGPFKPAAQGAILKHGAGDELLEIRYENFSPKYAGYLKNLGIIFVGRQEMPHYARLLADHAAKDIDAYFLSPWADNLSLLPAKVLDLGENSAVSFNTREEYLKSVEILSVTDALSVSKALTVELADIVSLKPIEGHDRRRAETLAVNIAAEGFWKVPLCVDFSTGMIMDGHHRRVAATVLGLAKVPVIYLDYQQIPIWSLKPDIYPISLETLLEKNGRGEIYPYKTVKHKFPPNLPHCLVSLDELKGEAG